MSGNSINHSDTLEWTTQQEILLFHSMRGLKPVGINRHFMMAIIHAKFSKLINKQISSKLIWQHLDTMYDMEALHESERIPFPNEEVEFELLEEFDDLAIQRLGAPLPHSAKNSKTNAVNSGKKSGSWNKTKRNSASASSTKSSNSSSRKSSISSASSAETNKSFSHSEIESGIDEATATKYKKAKVKRKLDPQMKLNTKSHMKKPIKPETLSSVKHMNSEPAKRAGGKTEVTCSFNEARAAVSLKKFSRIYSSKEEDIDTSKETLDVNNENYSVCNQENGNDEDESDCELERLTGSVSDQRQTPAMDELQVCYENPIPLHSENTSDNSTGSESEKMYRLSDDEFEYVRKRKLSTTEEWIDHLKKHRPQ